MDFLSGEIENILFTPTKTSGFLSVSFADGGAVLLGSPADGRQNVFGYARLFCSRDIGTGDDWLHVQNVSGFC
jgi:hypothetical protein